MAFKASLGEPLGGSYTAKRTCAGNRAIDHHDGTGLCSIQINQIYGVRLIGQDRWQIQITGSEQIAAGAKIDCYVATTGYGTIKVTGYVAAARCHQSTGGAGAAG